MISSDKSPRQFRWFSNNCKTLCALFLVLSLMAPAAYAVLPPVADAGPPQTVNEQTPGVTLDGSGSNDNADAGEVPPRHGG